MYLCYPKTGQQRFEYEKRGPGDYYHRWVVARIDTQLKMGCRLHFKFMKKVLVIQKGRKKTE